MHGWTADELAIDFERRVAEGDLMPGDRLPPVRALAADLKIAPNTVAGAYRRLADRGITVGRGRRGTFVTTRLPIAVPHDREVPTGLLDLYSGNPDPELLPDLDRTLRDMEGPKVLYGCQSVDESLAVHGARVLAADGVATEHLAVVSGGLDGLERVLQAHLRRGDRVAVEDPGYPPVIDLVGALGLVAVPVAIDDEGLTPGSLEQVLARGVAAVVVTPRAQNPFGSALSEDRATDLRSLLSDHPHVLVIEDDHAAAVAGAPMHWLGESRDRWATIRSAAKTYGPDVRLALLAGDRVTIRRVESRQRLGPGWVSHILQRLVAGLMSDRTVDGRLGGAADIYASRRATMIRALGDRGFRAHGASGLNVWVPIPDESATVAAMADRGYAIRGGSRYRIRSESGVRLTVASLDEAHADRVADALLDAVSELGPGARIG
jgi:DNA-binding transcriptional MocR family regulator